MPRSPSIETDYSSQAGSLASSTTTFGKRPSRSSDNGNNKINPERLEAILGQLGYYYTRSEVENMLISINPGNETTAQLDDFITTLDSKVQDVAPDVEIAQTFQLFDREKTGFITSDNLYLVMGILGQKVNKEQLNAIFEEADLDGDGVINYDDFYRLVKRKESCPSRTYDSGDPIG